MALTDRSMAKLGKDREALKEEIKALNAEVAVIDRKLIAEFERRGTESLVSGGVKVSKVTGESVVYHQDEIMKDLPPRLLKLATQHVLDMGLVSGLVQEGKIKPAWLDRRSHIQERAPYIRVSGDK